VQAYGLGQSAWFPGELFRLWCVLTVLSLFLVSRLPCCGLLSVKQALPVWDKAYLVMV
jgi:hypothetical protein